MEKNSPILGQGGSEQLVCNNHDENTRGTTNVEGKLVHTGHVEFNMSISQVEMLNRQVDVQVQNSGENATHLGDTHWESLYR